MKGEGLGFEELGVFLLLLGWCTIQAARNNAAIRLLLAGTVRKSRERLAVDARYHHAQTATAAELLHSRSGEPKLQTFNKFAEWLYVIDKG
jgi:hypothetical protein